MNGDTTRAYAAPALAAVQAFPDLAALEWAWCSGTPGTGIIHEGLSLLLLWTPAGEWQAQVGPRLRPFRKGREADAARWIYDGFLALCATVRATDPEWRAMTERAEKAEAAGPTEGAGAG